MGGLVAAAPGLAAEALAHVAQALGDGDDDDGTLLHEVANRFL